MKLLRAQAIALLRGCGCKLTKPQRTAVNSQVNWTVFGPNLILIPGLGEQIGSVEFPQEQCGVFASPLSGVRWLWLLSWDS